MDELNTLAGLLVENNLTITTAESCTGGLIAGRLVDYPGISTVFKEGHVTYSAEAKCKYLGIDMSLIDRFGVVSAEVAEAMARGALKAADADIALSTTGIAGPDGGDADHPVGLVYIACAFHDKVSVRRFVFPGDRSEVRTQAVTEALKLAIETIQEIYR